MTINKLLILAVCAAFTCCEDICIFDLNLKETDLQFDLTSLTKIQAVNFIKFNDSVNIKLCKINNEKEFICDEINSKVCLMKIPKTKTDIGSEIIDERMICTNSSKWSTVIYLSCSYESQLIHDSTNMALCTNVFQWKTSIACEALFSRKNHCMVTHPQYSGSVFNMSDLKAQTFDVNDYINTAKYRFSVCSPLSLPCNGNLDSAACWSFDGVEINIGQFTEQLMFDNGKIYLYMHGEKCYPNGPNSLTTIRFLCDYSNSKFTDLEKDLEKCTFDFIIYTKHACTQPLEINCTIDDKMGNVYDLSSLKKFNSNYIINVGPRKNIILNVCHSVISNDANGINCQPNSGVCLSDSNNSSTSNWYSNLGDVNENPRIVGNTILLEMKNGFYNNHSITSIIEFTCSNKNIGPILLKNENHKYTLQWSTPLACSSRNRKQKRDQKYYLSEPNYSITINGLNYDLYLCSTNIVDINYNLAECGTSIHNQRTVVLIVNGQKMKYSLSQNFNFVHFINKTSICNYRKSQRETVVFHLLCGFEFQKPKIMTELCVTDVFIVDSKLCDSKLECKTNLYDFTLIKGNYIVKNDAINYYLSICQPGYNGIGGLMELGGKNYSLGYQMTSPKKKEVINTYEITLSNGDYCKTEKLTVRYSTIITLECDYNEAEGHPKFVTNKHCALEFLWKTSLICSKKLVDFNLLTCTATFEIYGKKYLSIKTIDLQTILNINKLLNNSTNSIYQVNFCNGSICSNESKCMELLSVQYDVYNKQLITSFKNVNGGFVTSLDVVTKCRPILIEDSPTYKMSLSDDGKKITVNTYLKSVCCIDYIEDTSNDTECNKYILTSTNLSSESTNNVENQLPMLHENDKSHESKKNEHPKNSDLIITPNKEQIEESSVPDVINNKIINSSRHQQNYGKILFADYENLSTTDNQVPSTTNSLVPSTSLPTAGIVLIVLVLISLPLFYFYKRKILKSTRRVINSYLLVRRRRGSYIHDNL